ncbi:hypothetical protein C0Q70_01198 [Pomacea canaliculata]|uniref:Vitellogenin domain-containing protein n=1 Tax=Pomacea canaliculata TaxID=400727 RepID=A0A2T7PYT3_POMCA|nr:hypothetical protein C0Q70_01198 [Pomacea canaliculata]
MAATMKKDVGVQLSITFELIPLVTGDEQFLKVQLTSAKYNSMARPNNEVAVPELLKYPAFFEMTGDTINKVYLVEGDSIFATNIKKGIMALFQIKEEAGERTEVLGLTVWMKATMSYEIEDSIIQRAGGTSHVVSYINSRTSLNGGLISSQKLSMENISDKNMLSSLSIEEAVSKAETEIGKSLVMSLLPSDNEITQCDEDCQSPKELAGKLHDDLTQQKLASLDSAKAFVKMLRSFRNSGTKAISEVFSSPDSYYIVPQLIDVAAAAQTSSSQEALMGLLSFEDDYAVDYPERYLLAAAYSTHPSEALIRDLMGVLGKPIPSETLKESVLLGLAAVTHTYCQIRDQCSHKVIKEVQQLLVSGLWNCGQQTCQQMYLRALGNAGLSDTVPVILPFTETPAVPMLSVTAINALRRIHRQYINNEVKNAMLRIFHQTTAQYDSTVRSAALELILKNQPSPHVLRNILLTALDQTNAEFSSYIVRCVIDTATFDVSLRESLHAVLQDPSINNYYILSQKGKSSIFTSYLAKTAEINATYTMFIENTNSGVMKKSGMDVSLLGRKLKEPFMKFGIYAEGLESLVGDTEESEETNVPEKESPAPAEPTAGMTFTLMDVLLRQIEFFRGSAGLMSAVWNAPSELTSALQANLLLQDHSQRVHLSNGLVVEVQVVGVLSVDLSGYVSISLWNRNCEALVKNSGALYIEGSMRIDSSLLKSGLVFKGEGQSSIDFQTDADFYEMPLKLCMQMMRPEFTFRQSFSQYEKLKGLKTLRRKTAKISKVPFESFFLNKANSEECKLLKKE